MASSLQFEPFRSGPFPYEDLLRQYFGLLSVHDLARCARVSPAWHAAVKLPAIWLRMFDEEKMQRIEGGEATAYQDFNVMFPITYSKRKFACLGGFVGDVPMMSAISFSRLKNVTDPYTPLNQSKKMVQTFVHFIEPTYLYRDYNRDLVDELDENGDFDSTAPENQDLETKGILVPYSLKNVKVLAEYPVSGVAPVPVFCFVHSEILNQCSQVSKKVNATLMRREVPFHTRNLTLAGQKKHLKGHGYEMVRARTRMCFNVIEILTKGSCPDKFEKKRWIYCRTADGFKVYHRTYSVSIGGFYGGTGMNFTTFHDHAHGDIGAIPCEPVRIVRPDKRSSI